MSVLHVKDAGPMMTVQDLGRAGLSRFGVSGAGPMDTPSLRIANRLVGNAETDAGLEFAQVGGTFVVDTPVRIAVTGAAVGMTIDGKPLHAWESHHLLPGQTLRIGAVINAVWGYLAISGGIDTPPVLGARTTHLRTGLGGLDGRRLAAGDRLPLGTGSSAPLLAMRQPLARPRGPFRIVPGPQAGHFDAAAWKLFLEEPFRIATHRDRMAQMLDGPAISAFAGHDIISDGTVAGSIQVPSSGRPIVLMAERQTTGGYPKIATVATIDLPRLAQAMTGSSVRFRVVSRDEAEDLLMDQSRALTSALAGLEEKRETTGIKETTAMSGRSNA
ncbi:biotin-dependent carboxyltransferase family protein [Rhizobium sp. NFR03]|uniref:5-oxoprolinase subunit C family protein n=1 Tax=Rhizobium sp. NFR03 TaxID=1566263 RepID=UPI0008B907CC|nr:biotin-dependent carboxyltransferase family protein [Rhizobium sp. NFR03]SES44838.1 biotin-dependent carboxylase uncharacterized domain-containing protein [Rhizobium sp. NFR03]